MASIYELCMLYSAVAAVFVICCVLRNQTSSQNAISKVNFWLCVILCSHAVSIICYSSITLIYNEFNLQNESTARIIRAVSGFSMGFISFSYPYALFCLLRHFIKGKKLFDGFMGKNAFVIYAISAVAYIAGAVYVTYLYVITDESYATGSYEFFAFSPAILLFFYILVLKDLCNLVKDVVKHSFVSPFVRQALLYAIVYLPIILGPVGWMYKTPVSFICVLALVYVLQIVSNDRAISLDFLTGLNNRNELMRYLGRLYDKVGELDRNLKIIFIDINDFKMVNDTYGHNEGDKALLSISSCLKKSARSFSCFICRYAGDEFTVVLKETSLLGADDFVKKLRAELRAVNEAKEHPFELSVSTGIVRYSDKFKSILDFIHAADEQMYEEKMKYKKSKAAPLT